MVVLGHRLDGLTRYPRETTRVPLGTYQGLAFGLVLNPHMSPELYLEGATIRQAGLSRDHQGPRAVLNALERLASGYPGECDRVTRDLNLARSQLRDYQGSLDKPFPHENYLVELATLRDQLKARLSTTAQEPGKQEGPSISELSDQIKGLAAANTVESPADRVSQSPPASGDRRSGIRNPIPLLGMMLRKNLRLHIWEKQRRIRLGNRRRTSSTVS
jgi:hypothetical protein